jgi:hypothetical protein
MPGGGGFKAKKGVEARVMAIILGSRMATITTILGDTKTGIIQSKKVEKAMDRKGEKQDLIPIPVAKGIRVARAVGKEKAKISKRGARAKVSRTTPLTRAKSTTQGLRPMERPLRPPHRGAMA